MDATMIYLFVILFTLNASTVWAIGLLLANRKLEHRILHHKIRVYRCYSGYDGDEAGVHFWAPDDRAAATVMLTIAKD